MNFTSRVFQVAARSTIGLMLTVSSLAVGTPLAAAAPLSAAPTSKEGVAYRVKPGDSLWRISRRFYGNPHYWSKLYFANRAVIGPSTRNLHPGMILWLPSFEKALSPSQTLAESAKPGSGDTVTVEAVSVGLLEEAPGPEPRQEPEDLMALPVTSEEGVASPRRVSPVVLGAASLVLPGSGQILRGDWERGWAHMGLTAFSVGALQVGTNGADRGLRLAGGLALVGLSLWSAWDASRADEPTVSVE